MHHSHWSHVKLWLIAFVVAFVALSPLASPVAANAPASHGINPADMDLAVDPADDFYRYANGGWLDRTTIPAEFVGIETLSELDKLTRDRLLELLTERAVGEDLKMGSDEWKAIRLYEQGIDLATRNAQGIEPIRPVLDEIEAIDDLAALHDFFETSIFQNVNGLLFVAPGPDLFDSSETVAYLQPTGLGLPNYYEDATTQPLIHAYIVYMANQLTILGRDAAEARLAARAVFELEARLWDPLLLLSEVQGDLSATYNPTTIDELAAKYPMMDWPAYLAELGLSDVEQLVVKEPRYIDELDRIVRETPLPVIKDLLRLQLIGSSSSLLTEELEATAFAFYGTTLAGIEEQESIELRSFNRVNRFLGDALGKLYVEAYFSPEAKAQSAELAREVVGAFRERLERNPWMTAETKARALEKLDALHIKVGYPDQWQDYSEIAIADSYYDSVISAWNASYRDELAQVGAPVDREKWIVPPQTVTAYYSSVNNEIVIPAGILQPPFFDAQADPASNFGAIGFVVGHEITHAFDLQGSQFDGEGNLSDWWAPEDYARFQDLNEQVAAQYSAIEILPEYFIDGQLTVTENVADLGGIQVAYDALQRHLAKHGRPVIAEMDLTQEQRFFIAAASVWRAEMREEALVLQLMTDPHAPSSVRATQPLRNCDAFYAAFDIGPDDPMYVPPDERIVIW